MPLMKSKSKKAFEHNVKVEMEAHPDPKDRKRNLAIAYSVKRRAKKASGGTVESGSPDMNMARGGMYAEGGEISANNEKRPMPENEYFDREEVSRNAHRRDNGADGWTDNPTIKQAQKNNGREVLRIKHPKMVPSDVFSTRLRDEEDDLQMSAKPGPYGEQPPRHDDEEGPNRQGPRVPDMEDEHSTRRKPYAKGGKVEQSDYSHRPNKYEDDLTDIPPSEDEGSAMAHSHNEEGPDRQGPDISDHEQPHSEHDRMFRDNEHTQPDDMNPADHPNADEHSDDQPEDESQLMHEASIAAAIMAKRRRFARGGAILSEDSMETTDDDQADVLRNAEEDANMEDKASFDALRKENYDEEDALRQADNPSDAAMHGDEEEMSSHDSHDMVSEIRRKMKKRSPITR